MSARAEGRWQGMNWIRQSSRLAIYLRDGLACVYCEESVEDGAQLSLDHVKPHSKGGSNAATNLVTCCKHCNDSRGNRALSSWAEAVAQYRNHGIMAKDILNGVRAATRRKLNRAEAAELIARRGTCLKVISSL